MKMLISLAILITPGAVSAQSAQSLAPTVMTPNFTAASRDVEGYPFQSTVDTPTMRKQKLARAISFRREAAALLARDGGTFTADHQAYVQRKARDILTARR